LTLALHFAKVRHMQTSYIGTISSKGQFTFPSALRRASKIKAGHKIIITPHPTQKDQYSLTISHNIPRISLEHAFGALYDPKIKYIPIEVARDLAGEALGEKYATT